MFIRRLLSAPGLSGVVLLWALMSVGQTSPSHPYAEIAARNVFGLRPPLSAPAQRPAAPLPKILLTGITTILGDKRALLKVTFPVQARQPAKEKLYILPEGHGEGSIKVLKVDVKSECVKVDNGGTIMEIALEQPIPTKPPATPVVRPGYLPGPVPIPIRSSAPVRFGRR
jgi:hypothetical protein